MLRGVKTFSALASDLLARLPTMTDEERRLGLEIYRQLSHGAGFEIQTCGSA